MADHIHLVSFLIHSPINHTALSWAHPDDDRLETMSDIHRWQKLAQTLERGRFDGIFFADTPGVFDRYRDSMDDALRYGVCWPTHDPVPLACTFAVKQGVAGAIVHGGTRDTAPIIAMGFPVWATAISVEHPEKRGPGAVNVPMVVDGVLVEPGDVIAADDDGVLVIPRAELARTVAAAETRAAAEVEFRERIANGERLIDILGMKAVIEGLGIPQKDCTWAEDGE